jgi:hypothetical protein
MHLSIPELLDGAGKLPRPWPQSPVMALLEYSI